MTTLPTIRGRVGTNNSGTLPIPVNVTTDSTAPVTGDWMIVVINTTAATPTITVPSGFTQVLAPTAMGSRYMAVYKKIRAVDDPTQYSFSQSSTGAAQALAVWGPGANPDTTSWYAGSYLKGVSGTTQTTPGITTIEANTLALSLQAEATTATETDSQITVASPFIKDLWTIQASSPVNSILLSHRDMATAGATGDAVSTWVQGTGNRGSLMVAIPPAPDAAITRLAAKMADLDGSIKDVGVSWWTGTSEIQLSKIEVVYPGVKVDQLLSMTDRPFVMAHRGGSRDYQEHSMRGYTQCAIVAADALEFSLARTSDGVYFGLHDDTLNRTTSGLAANYKPGEHTWAEISALTQDLSNRGDTRFTTAPYMKLQDLIDTYGSSHTIFVDPKVIGGTYFNEMITLLKTFKDYKNTFVGKYYHTGTNVADLFSAQGMATWGYSYTGDVTGTNTDGTAYTGVRTSATASKWTMLGLEYSASQAAWDQILSIAGSKKVIAHICPTLATAQEGVAKGAKGIQASGINSVSPFPSSLGFGLSKFGTTSFGK
jgi:hypothetical protein